MTLYYMHPVVSNVFLTCKNKKEATIHFLFSVNSHIINVCNYAAINIAAAPNDAIRAAPATAYIMPRITTIATHTIKYA